MADQWVVWFNGEIVPEHEARVPFRDRGFKYGDAVFDTTRTFGHRIFKLDEHIDRLFRSLKYMRIDPGVDRATLVRATEEVTAENLKNVGKDEDIWVTQRITRGMEEADRAQWPGYPANTVIVESRPLPYRQRGKLFRNGMDVIFPSIRRPAPDTVSPRAKTNNYLNLALADLEVKAQNPEAVSVLLDTHGNLAEGRGSNIFLVRDGVVLTPRERFVLPGVSRATAVELARKNGMTVEETDLDLYDALNADEAFITSTSYCICPVRSFNGEGIGDGTIPGPVTRRLIDAYVDLVGCDWYGQYLRHANT
ncbi:MAG: aminotransferase class IV [Acetobacterales bacterium]